MITISAAGVSDGIAIGKIRQFKKKELEISSLHVEDVEAEILSYREASRKVHTQLADLYERTLSMVNEESAEIFLGHQMLLSDITFVEAVEEKIRTFQMSGVSAVACVRDELKAMFETMEDAYIRERAMDVVDVSNRLIRELSGTEDTFSEQEKTGEPFVLFADDLTPGELMQIDRHQILALVTRQGSKHSHTMILARTMHIPAVAGAEFSQDCHGKTVIVDGTKGMVYIEPNEEILETMAMQKNIDDKYRASLNDLRGKEDRTPVGKQICLYANAGNVADVLAALNHDAAGIGLFRTEFLFLENEKEPTEEEQFRIYKHIVELMDGKKVIFRTTDIGSDKQPKYMESVKEANPAMGYRAVRMAMDHPEMLKCQLRALYRASAYGTVSIMYPMVASVSEVEMLKALSKEVRQELECAGVKMGNVEEGIMIETPAAALISDRLAKMVDFFSIGTNDLAAFTLAMDRMNSKLTSFFDPNHEAIFRLIEMTIKNGHEAGIWVGICGEMAADLQWTKRFLQMGMDEFSVLPSMILPMRQKIRE